MIDSQLFFKAYIDKLCHSGLTPLCRSTFTEVSKEHLLYFIALRGLQMKTSLWFFEILPSPFKRTDQDREEDLGCVAR